MLSRHLRRRANNVPTLGKRLVFAGMSSPAEAWNRKRGKRVMHLVQVISRHSRQAVDPTVAECWTNVWVVGPSFSQPWTRVSLEAAQNQFESYRSTNRNELNFVVQAMIRVYSKCPNQITCWDTLLINSNVLQSWKAVSACLKSEQILPFDFQSSRPGACTEHIISLYVKNETVW